MLQQGQIGIAWVDLRLRGDLEKQLSQQRAQLEAATRNPVNAAGPNRAALDEALRIQDVREQSLKGLGEEITQLRAREALLSSPQGTALYQQRLKLSQQVAQLEAAAAAKPQTTAAEQAAQSLFKEKEALKQDVALIQARNKYYASPSGQRYLQEQVRLEKEKAKAMQEGQRQQTRATNPLGIDFSQLKADLASLGQSMSMAFAAGTAGMMGLIGAASPSHFATVIGGFQLLSSAIGRDLLPYVTALNERLWAAREYWLGLSEVTRGFIARLAVAGVSLAGTIATLYAAGAVLSKLWVMLQGIGNFVAARMGLMFSPMGAGIAGLVVAVTALAAAWRLVGDNTRDAGDAAGNIRLDDQGRAIAPDRARTAITQQQMAVQTPETQQRLQAAAGNLQEMARVLADAEKKAREEADQARRANIAPTPEQQQRILAAGQAAWERTGNLRPAAEAMQAAGMRGTVEEIERFARQELFGSIGNTWNFFRPQAMTGEAFQRFNTQQQARAVGPLDQRLDAIREMMQNLTGGKGAPEAFRPPMTSRFQEFAQYGMSLQEAAFRQDDQQLQLLRDHLDALNLTNQLLRDMSGFNRDQAAALRTLTTGL